MTPTPDALARAKEIAASNTDCAEPDCQNCQDWIQSIARALDAQREAQQKRVLDIIAVERQEAFAMAAGEALIALDRIAAAIRAGRTGG